MAELKTIEDFLKYIVEVGASDLHLKAGHPPVVRLHGDLKPIEGVTPMEAEDTQRYVYSVLSDRQKQKFEEEKELDFSFQVRGMARFRGNAFFQKGMIGAVFRIIPHKIPRLDDIGVAPAVKEILDKHQGLVLVTGPTGSGKSTTLASIIDYVNEIHACHIITIEDPIEFVYNDKKALINQREVGSDTTSFVSALKRALRQDPDVILLGELRDQETISTAMTAAETGHLVFGTLHTNTAPQTIDRILDVYSPDQQNQVRMQLAKVLLAVLSQRLLKSSQGGRVLLQEVLINTPTVQKMIEDNKIGMIQKALEDGKSFYHTQSFNQALFDSVKAKKITLEEAMSYSTNPNDLKIKLQTSGVVP